MAQNELLILTDPSPLHSPKSLHSSYREQPSEKLWLNVTASTNSGATATTDITAINHGSETSVLTTSTTNATVGKFPWIHSYKKSDRESFVETTDQKSSLSNTLTTTTIRENTATLGTEEGGGPQGQQQRENHHREKLEGYEKTDPKQRDNAINEIKQKQQKEEIEEREQRRAPQGESSNKVTGKTEGSENTSDSYSSSRSDSRRQKGLRRKREGSTSDSFSASCSDETRDDDAIKHLILVASRSWSDSLASYLSMDAQKLSATSIFVQGKLIAADNGLSVQHSRVVVHLSQSETLESSLNESDWELVTSHSMVGPGANLAAKLYLYYNRHKRVRQRHDTLADFIDHWFVEVHVALICLRQIYQAIHGDNVRAKPELLLKGSWLQVGRLWCMQRHVKTYKQAWMYRALYTFIKRYKTMFSPATEPICIEHVTPLLERLFRRTPNSEDDSLPEIKESSSDTLPKERVAGIDPALRENINTVIREQAVTMAETVYCGVIDKAQQQLHQQATDLVASQLEACKDPMFNEMTGQLKLLLEKTVDKLSKDVDQGIQDILRHCTDQLEREVCDTVQKDILDPLEKTWSQKYQAVNVLLKEGEGRLLALQDKYNALVYQQKQLCDHLEGIYQLLGVPMP